MAKRTEKNDKRQYPTYATPGQTRVLFPKTSALNRLWKRSSYSIWRGTNSSNTTKDALI